MLVDDWMAEASGMVLVVSWAEKSVWQPEQASLLRAYLEIPMFIHMIIDVQSMHQAMSRAWMLVVQEICTRTNLGPDRSKPIAVDAAISSLQRKFEYPESRIIGSVLQIHMSMGLY